MTTSEWRDCIVTLFDLVDAKKDGGSKLMRRLHDKVARAAPSLRSIHHAYTYNDSVLTVSFLDEWSAEEIMHDAERLKRQIDRLRESYGIAVKGQAFPPLREAAKRTADPRVTVINASSWAMANCFAIEQALGRRNRMWYVDSRIANKLTTDRRGTPHPVVLLPRGKRDVFVYGGYLWN